MYRKGPQGWLKHLDFTVLNLIALHASYCMAYLYGWEQRIRIIVSYIGQ